VVAPHAPVDSPSAKEESVMNWKHAVSLALLLRFISRSAASAITYDKDGRYGYSMNQSSSPLRCSSRCTTAQRDRAIAVSPPAPPAKAIRP
jgi:hypothetical protein